MANGKTELLNLAAAGDGPDGFQDVVAEAVEVVVQNRRVIGVADDQFDFVADLQVAGFAFQVELAVFGADSGNLRAGVTFDDWRFEIRVVRFSTAVQDSSFEYRTLLRASNAQGGRLTTVARMVSAYSRPSTAH